MKIPKAIEILTEWKEPETIKEAGELLKAKELGIEALKRVLGDRKGSDNPYHLPLIGEE